MPFSEVPNKMDFPAQEREVLKFWKENQAFEKMLALHQGQPKWSFIDGPITANNPMGVHHGWGRTYKDLMLRFRTMQGHELRYHPGEVNLRAADVVLLNKANTAPKADVEALAATVRRTNPGATVILGASVVTVADDSVNERADQVGSAWALIMDPSNAEELLRLIK